MPLVTASGLRVHVQRLGTSGAPVVMLHGLLLGSLAQWYFTAAPALARKHEVLLYDLRGHGLSERAPSGYDLANMARDLDALTASESRPLSLVGHSYGALIALRYALERPHRVHKLVLVDAPLPPARFGEFAAFLRRTPEEMIDALPAAMRAVLAGGARKAQRLLDSLHFLVEHSSLRADVEAERDIPDAVLGDLPCETLCLYGARSPCAPVGERLSRTLPRARLAMLPGGHYLHLEARAELTEQLVRFLDG